jgi:hypothetical protein
MYLPIFLSILAFFLRCPKIANTEKIQLSKVGIILARFFTLPHHGT